MSHAVDPVGACGSTPCTVHERVHAALLGCGCQAGCVRVQFTAGTAPALGVGKTGLAVFDRQGVRYGVYDIRKAFPFLDQIAASRTLSARTQALRRVYYVLQDEVHDPRSVAAALSRDPFVEYAEPDFVRLPMGDIGGARPGRSALPEFPNDPLYTDAPYVDRFQLPEAWDVVIATPDRGTDGRLPDPINIHWTNPGEIPGNGINDEGNGFVDDVHGWNFSNYTPDATANPPDGFEAHHGTGIAGAAAAEVNNGSDDGLVYVTRDGGGKWQEVTPEGMPEWMMINDIVAHPFEPGGAYMAGTHYKLYDFQPYLYRTVDFGLSWTKLTDGIDGLHFARAI